MAQAISNKVLVRSNKYAWMICDYSLSGTTMNYTLSYHFDGGDAQLDNAWIKVGNTTVWSNPGRVMNYTGQDSRGEYNYTIYSGSANISGTQTVTFGITKYSGVNQSGSFTVTGGTLPSGGYINNIAPAWNSVTTTYGLANGGTGLTASELKILKAPYAAYVPAYQVRSDSSSIGPFTVTVNNNSTKIHNPNWEIKGCGLYYTGVWASNSAGEYRYQGPTFYTPPAPSQFTYTDPGDEGTKVFPVSFAGVSADNNTDYTSSELTRTIRYKIDNGPWVYVDNNTNAAIDFVTNFNVSVPAGSTATVEGWQTYRGLNSEVRAIVLANTNMVTHFYGSRSLLTKKVVKMRGPHPVTHESKKIVKFYMSVGGVARKVFEDV